MSLGVLSPNLTKKFQWEVSQIAKKKFPCAMLLGGLSVNLNHLKMRKSCTFLIPILWSSFLYGHITHRETCTDEVNVPEQES